MEQWEQFFSELTSFLRLIQLREEGANSDVAEATILRIENYEKVLSAIHDRLEVGGSVVEDVCKEVKELLHSLQEIKLRWENVECGVKAGGFVAERRQGDGPGRPKVFIR